jgi:hypothetical protein
MRESLWGAAKTEDFGRAELAKKGAWVRSDAARAPLARSPPPLLARSPHPAA